MTLIKDKYSYVQHQRKEIDGNRFYLDSNGNPVAISDNDSWRN